MCDTNCWLFCLTGTMYLHWVPMMLKRTALREHFNIEGDVCRDGLVCLSQPDPCLTTLAFEY